MVRSENLCQRDQRFLEVEPRVELRPIDGALLVEVVRDTVIAVRPARAGAETGVDGGGLRGESLLALAPIYWLLLDLLQGVYSMEDITADHVRRAFFGIGLFVVMVWLGAIRRSWKLPKVLITSVSEEFPVNTYFALAIACFFLGMLNFAVPCNFNVFEMVHYLGKERWVAPWGRGQLGGWDA